MTCIHEMKTNCDLKHFKEETLLRVLYFIEWKRDFYKRFKKNDLLFPSDMCMYVHNYLNNHERI